MWLDLAGNVHDTLTMVCMADIHLISLSGCRMPHAVHGLSVPHFHLLPGRAPEMTGRGNCHAITGTESVHGGRFSGGHSGMCQHHTDGFYCVDCVWPTGHSFRADTILPLSGTPEGTPCPEDWSLA